jgi:hypothetical protein
MIAPMRWAALVSMLAACGGGDDSPTPDSAPEPACADVSEVELGTGLFEFPMPDRIPLRRGQAIPFISINPYVRGIPPGTDDPFDPANPKTRVTGVLVEDPSTTFGYDAPSTLGYVPSPIPCTFQQGGDGYRMTFNTTRPQIFVGKQLLIRVEVVGSNGLAAYTEKQVVVYDPILNQNYNIE